ncbi:MAG: hypothetical protein KJ904_00030 [Alphaproteobacteria bacterium]|uniref:Uncharacterized protein n=1 Tax=viral metagenome TaxID=1070528 RepID=A0A6M3MAK5_9ZZZZ|nr:hypothetical protein [Alphaproteobacteria bacterium]MBU0798640.1 hypothetical protein [Alphaproteobacteria bacterium]MBU0885530.1 hypothetical protein [Alphaproteobacteria bacterium]MBU1811892.1 hypothetical protein [Alphaproteobacteria bacterium]MBU2090460.1 hypothetical protein [Alphaproteobacteria bacterium]
MNIQKAMRLKQQAENLHAGLMRLDEDVREARRRLTFAQEKLNKKSMEELLRPIRQTEIREDGRRHEFKGINWKEIKRRQRALDGAERDLRRIQAEHDELAERWRRAWALVTAVQEITGAQALETFAADRSANKFSGIMVG